jgi:hypothetical protein
MINQETSDDIERRIRTAIRHLNKCIQLLNEDFAPEGKIEAARALGALKGTFVDE